MLCVSSVNGQTAFGVKGGVSISKMTDHTYKSRVSGHGGVFVNRSLSKHFFVQPELLFSGEGEQFLSNGEHTLALDYILLPVMIQYYPVPQVYVEVGPQVGVLISAKDKTAGAAHRNVKANISTAQYAISTGLGVMASDHLIVYGRYNFGLSDITSLDAIKDKSNVLQIGIALRFEK